MSGMMTIKDQSIIKDLGVKTHTEEILIWKGPELVVPIRETTCKEDLREEAVNQPK